jgi:hypothetical protein
MQPVWVLSVDLQTKTATFQSGLGDAARSARGAFTEIKGGAGEMGRSVGGSMTEARHGVMLLGEEFGVHLPRALTSFIASIGPVGAAMEAAFPFLAIAVGATLLIEHLVKMKEAGEKLTEDQVKFGTAVQNAFNQLDTRLIQAQIRADELRNDHLGALKGQLELIDRQSMEELVHSFELVAKAADVVFKELKSSWYEFNIGSAGAKHALDDFQTKYEALLAKHQDKEASDLLRGTRDSAQHILAMQNTLKSGNWGPADKGGVAATDNPAYQKAINDLKAAGVGYTDKEIQAQQELVDALTAQERIEQKVADLKKLESANASKSAGNEAAGQQAAAQRQAAESMARMGEQAIAADRAVSQEQLSVKRASAEERLRVDLDFADREYQLHLAANQQEIAALDKSGKDYQNQLKALQAKELELSQQHETQVTELKSKAATEAAAKELRDLEQGEREKIDATQKASAARLAVIDAAIKEEESRNLQDTSFYRELLTQRIETARQMAEEEAKLKAEAGQEAAEQEQKMGELALTAEKQHQQLLDSARRVSDQRRAAEEKAFADEEYNLKLKALQREEAALDKSGKDYANKLKAIQDKEKQLTQQHENEITAIKQKAEEERNARILSAEERFNDEISRGLTSVLMRHQSFAAMVTSLGDQVVSGMMQNAIKSVLMDDFSKERDAAAAARKAYLAGMQFPFPANIVMGPTLGAMAFASVMAFQGGTDAVPGVGRGDIVPAMLEPGEGVVPKGVMEGLNNLARSGGLNGGGNNTVVHVRPVYHVQTIDGDGMQAALEKHTDVLQRQFENTLRKMNR